MDSDQVEHFRAFGCVVLRRAFEARPLSEELSWALEAGTTQVKNTGVARVQYLPMMTERTPRSLELLEKCGPWAARLLGGPVLPVRAKGMRYEGSTGWHSDSSSRVASVGFAAYLESLDAETGALRVIPGSHRPEFGAATAAYLASMGPRAAVESLPGLALATEPGDLIAFDEHLFHASTGGGIRRQWRVDFIRDPESAAQREDVVSYLAGIFDPGWDGGYDPEAFPSYGPAWLAAGNAAKSRLGELGAYEMASRQEDFMRSRRRE